MSYYYSIRITSPTNFYEIPTENPEEFPEFSRKVKKITSTWTAFVKHALHPDNRFADNTSTYGYCIEQTNKFGEPCDTHLHFNFLSSRGKEVIRTKLKKWFAEVADTPLKGSSGGANTYCIKQHHDVDDEERFFRYLLKDKKAVTRMLHGYDKEDLATLVAIAEDERTRSIKANINARSKTLMKKTVYDRLEAHLETEYPNDSHIDVVFKLAAAWYIENTNGLCFKTVKAATAKYCVKHKFISIEEWRHLCENGKW